MEVLEIDNVGILNFRGLLNSLEFTRIRMIQSIEVDGQSTLATAGSKKATESTLDSIIDASAYGRWKGMPYSRDVALACTTILDVYRHAEKTQEGLQPVLEGLEHLVEHVWNVALASAAAREESTH